MDREFEMLVFGHSGFPVIAFPTSNARYYELKDFGIVSSVENLVDSGKIKIYCPDGIDSESWFNHSISPGERIKKHIDYENLILNEVINFAKHETGNDKVALAGFSFGAYHALNLAFRHPDKVNSLICVGGSFNIKRLIHDYFDDNYYFNNPPDYMPNLTDTWYLDRIKKMGIILGTGEWDMCLQDNIEMSNILKSKSIDHRLDIKPGTGHDWHWWKEMFPQYLSLLKF